MLICKRVLITNFPYAPQILVEIFLYSITKLHLINGKQPDILMTKSTFPMNIKGNISIYVTL